MCDQCKLTPNEISDIEAHNRRAAGIPGMKMISAREIEAARVKERHREKTWYEHWQEAVNF